jgi:diguanylate cyclase (GGDEF)-like protein
MAMYDQLTGLYNRHYLFISANKKVARAKRHHEPVSLMMMDIDHFKDINDNYGHPVGDVVLQAVAKIISAQCREEDIAARFGGEEFVILYDHCDLKDAQVKAENYRLLIEEAKPEQITVTSSFGVVQMKPEGEMVDDLIKRADLALYQAKENGRNQVVIAE